MSLDTALNLLSLFGLFFLGSGIASSILLILFKYEVINWLDSNLPGKITPICIFCIGFWLGLLSVIGIAWITNYPIDWVLLVPAFAAASRTVETISSQS